MGRRIFVSVSGGESSGEMAVRIKERQRPDDELLFMFANVGIEDERCLVFVDRLDREYGLNMVWVESVVDPRPRKVTTHRVVTFDTATRNESLFEAMIQKYGIPNKGFPHCTRELKLRPMMSYLKSIGWTAGTFNTVDRATTAIGIRADEIDRQDADARAKGYVYPLIQANVTKPDVHAAWDARSFQLGMPEHHGNCPSCWKKSWRKLMTLATESPQKFWAFRRFEQEYAHAGAGEGPRTFYRGGKSVDDIFRMAVQPFEPFVDTRGQEPPLFDMTQWDDLDLDGACGDHCEPFGHETSPELEHELDLASRPSPAVRAGDDEGGVS